MDNDLQNPQPDNEDNLKIQSTNNTPTRPKHRSLFYHSDDDDDGGGDRMVKQEDEKTHEEAVSSQSSTALLPSRTVDVKANVKSRSRSRKRSSSRSSSSDSSTNSSSSRSSSGRSRSRNGNRRCSRSRSRSRSRSDSRRYSRRRSKSRTSRSRTRTRSASRHSSRRHSYHTSHHHYRPRYSHTRHQRRHYDDDHRRRQRYNSSSHNSHRRRTRTRSPVHSNHSGNSRYESNRYHKPSTSSSSSRTHVNSFQYNGNRPSYSPTHESKMRKLDEDVDSSGRHYQRHNGVKPEPKPDVEEEYWDTTQPPHHSHQTEPNSKRVKVDVTSEPATVDTTDAGHTMIKTPPFNQINEITSTVQCDDVHEHRQPEPEPTTSIVEATVKSTEKPKSKKDKSSSKQQQQPHSKKKKKKDKLRRSVRIKTIKTQKECEKEAEISERLQNYQHHEATEAADYLATTGLGTQASGQTTLTSPKPFKKMLLTKAINDVVVGYDHYGHLDVVDKSKWPKFDHLNENQFLIKKSKLVVNKETKRMLCDCSTSDRERGLGIQACGDECLNRMLMIECGTRCPCGDWCTNRRFQRRQYAPVVPYETPMKGWGVKALEDIRAGTFIIEYIGEVIGLGEFKRRAERINEATTTDQHFYFMSLRNDQIIDASKKGNIARFMNHSCDPNCETQKWTINGELRIGFFARKNIKKDEELTFDYQFQTFGEKQQSCYCGADKCRGVLGTTSSNGTNFDQLWDDTEDEDEEEENDEASDGDGDAVSPDAEEENNENERAKQRKQKSSDKKKKYKKHDDLDLEDQLAKMRALTTRESVLKLCQLIFRAENIQNRNSILDILMNTRHEACLKLFIDYHGLNILWSWLVDIDRQFDLQHTNLKLKILTVLETMPIKNRTIVEECKLYAIVKRLSDESIDERMRKANDFNPLFNNSNENGDVSGDAKQWIEGIVNSLAESVDQKSAIKTTFEQIKAKAKRLYEQWGDLHEAFKIPKKQRIEERKEHERELNVRGGAGGGAGNSLLLSGSWEKGFKGGSDSRKHHSNGEAMSRRGTEKVHAKGSRLVKTYSDENEPRMTKEERRLLFELKVRDLETLRNTTSLTSTITPTDTPTPTNTHMADTQYSQLAAAAVLPPQQQFKWVIDPNLGQWVQIPVDDASSYGAVAPPPPPPQPPVYLNHDVWSLHAGRVPVPPQYYGQMPYYYHYPPPPPPPPPPTQPILSTLPPALIQIQTTKEDDDDDDDTAVPPPPPPQSPPIRKDKKPKLPANWKCAKNEQGRVYYYNKVTKKSQWHLPRETSTSTAKISSKKAKKAQVTVKEDVSLLPVAVEDTTTTTTDEEYKKRKDKLREMISKLIIKLLQSYMQMDCKYGRITNTDDFKHLARKFTHTILEKELERNTKPDDEDDFNKRVKVKTKEYMRKYMQKFNDEYCRKTDDSQQQQQAHVQVKNSPI